ncbi:MAG: cytochrome oxidase putative small subunit CydP [Janthinobacterium lividum]
MRVQLAFEACRTSIAALCRIAASTIDLSALLECRNTSDRQPEDISIPVKTCARIRGASRETASRHSPRRLLEAWPWQRKYRLTIEICAVVLIKLALLMVLRHCLFDAPAAPDMRMAPADVAQALLSNPASVPALVSPRPVSGTKG